MSDCLTYSVVQAVIEGNLDDDARRRTLEHVDGCPACRELVAQAGDAAALAAPHAVADDAGGALARGVQVGRYVVIDLVGAGAMGEVHSAYDPDLDRKVALKILRPERAEAGGDLPGRLLREAQAMARLSHPNVVPVHDAGTFGTQLFVAMELVEGHTLSSWLRERKRGHREVLRAFLDAGRGLAAAHAAGIVHRDFKPDNVLVGKDGRARVTDFGLSRSTTVTADRAGDASPDLPVETLTRTGQLVGTPAYMAPEQVTGNATPASDQFSFCVALHEALFGVRPFAGRSLGDLVDAIRNAEVEPPAPDARAPMWIRRLLLRGLASRPEARFPSMTALLDALERDPWRRARRAAGLALVVGMTVAAAVLASRGSRRASLMCKGAELELAAVWSEARRADVGATLLAGRQSYAPTVAATVQRALDEYTRGWVQMYGESCEATRVGGSQSEELLDLRAACLRRARNELGALVAALSRPAPGLVDQAVKAAYSLPPLASCEADAALRARTAPPRDAATAARVEELRGAMARTRALRDTTRHEAAAQAAPALHLAAQAIAYLPVEAEALALLADTQLQRRKVDDAVATYELAFRVAAAAGADGTAAQALAGEIWASGFFQGKETQASALIRYAEALAERAGDRKMVGNITYAASYFALQAGDYATAEARLVRALQIREQVIGPDSPEVASTLNALAGLYMTTGELAKARAYGERALALLERTSGRDNPFLIGSMNNLGRVLLELGEYEAAVVLFERVHEVSARRSPENHEVALSLMNLSVAKADLGDYAAGIDLLERGLRMGEATWGPEHDNVATAHDSLADLLLEVGRYDAALLHAQRALAIREKMHPTEHLDLVESLTTRARVQAAMGRTREALADAERAVAMAPRVVSAGSPFAIRAQLARCVILQDAGPADAALAACGQARAAAEHAFPDGHPLVARALALVASAELASGQAAQALAPAERAVAYLDGRRGDLPVRAGARFALARALAQTGGELGRARALARSARADLELVGSTDPRARAAIDTWLAVTPPGTKPD